MEKTLLLLGLLILLLDCTSLHWLRDLLLDFLVGARNRKNARRIHDAQRYEDRLTMGYIGGMLKRYQREFRFYLRLYHGFLISLLPKYGVLLALAVIFDAGKPFRIALYCFTGLGLLFFLLIRLQFDSLHTSRFARKK